MGILGRISDIFKSNANSFLDNIEEPVKILDQKILEAKEQLVDVRHKVASIMASEKEAQKKVGDLEKEIHKWENAAKEALLAENEEDATIFIHKKQTLQEQLAVQNDILSAAKLNAQSAHESYVALQVKISEFESKRDVLQGKVAATKAKESVNKMQTSISKGKNFGGIDDIEKKINRKFDIAMAEGELLKEPADEATKVIGKYTKGATDESVQEELSRLKKIVANSN